MEIEYSAEDAQNENDLKQNIIINKTKLGKKTFLNKNRNLIRGANIIKPIDKLEDDIDNEKEELIVIKNNIKNEDITQKENSSTFLLKTILKAYFLSIWKKKIKAMKYLTRGYNKQRTNFRKFINSISSVIKQHKFDYFNEICENMDSLPMPKNISHDYYFGTIRIVNKEILAKKYTDMITMWADNIYNNKINGFKIYLIEAFKKMKDIRELYGQNNFNEIRETDFSNYEKYIPYQEKKEQNIEESKNENDKEYMNELDENKENNDININESSNNNFEKKYLNNNKNNIQNENELDFNKDNNIDEVLDTDEQVERIAENDEYKEEEEDNNNYEDENYNNIKEENNYIEENYFVEEDNNNYEAENSANIKEENSYIDLNKNYIEQNNYFDEINLDKDNNYAEVNNCINENDDFANVQSFYIGDNNDLKENNYNNDDYIESEYIDNYSRNNEEINYDYNYINDKENDYNNNDFNENDYYENGLLIYEDHNEGNKDIKFKYAEDAYDNSNNHGFYNYGNLDIDFGNNNYEINSEYNATIDEDYNYQNLYNNINSNNYDNYNNYIEGECVDDYFSNDKNMQYNMEENYYYEEPNQQIETKEVTYYIPYNNNNNKFRYLTHEGNNILVNDVYTKPKISNNGSQTNIHIFKNSSNKNKANYINFNYKAESIGMRGAKKTKNNNRAFPSRYDNHSFYISK